MSGKNPVLASILARLNWPNTRLVTEINAIMGKAYVSRSTVSEWVNQGRIPHDPLPTVVAHILSGALEVDVSVSELWQGGARHSVLWMPSDVGFDIPWNAAGIRAVLADWLTNGGNRMDLDRRTFLAVSGAAVTGPAWAYVDSLGNSRPASLGFGGDGAKVTPGMVSVIDHTVRGLRHLDDQEGGGQDNLRVVHRQFRAVIDHLKRGQFAGAKVEQRLLAAWAQVSQIGGWMAYDAEQHGLAQRYLRTGLQAAYSAGDKNMGAHILACMAYEATSRGEFTDGTELADAAVEAAEHCHPVVRALVWSRFAYTHAAIGNALVFRQGVEKAEELLQHPGAMDTRPDWLYWFDPDSVHLKVQTGHSLLALGSTTSHNAEAILREGEAMLAAPVEQGQHLSPRDQMYHAAWLARSCLRRGDVEQAIAIGRKAVTKRDIVQSPRATTILRQLDHDLQQQRGLAKMSEVVDFRDELRLTLAA